MCGEVADGLHVHPLNTPRYVREVILPNVAEGAQRAGRDAGEIALACPVFTIVGDTDEEQEQWRQRGALPDRVLRLDPDVPRHLRAPRLGRHAGAAPRAAGPGDLAGMAATITDEMLDEFAITSTWDGLADRIRARYEGVADQVIAYFSMRGWAGDPGPLERWSAVARSING